MRKRILGMVIAVLVLCTALAMPALAEGEDQQLDNVTNWGNTEVDATILDAAGEVAYIVTVPTKVDFGKLSCPDKDEDSFAIQKFTIACPQMQGVNNVKLYACNYGSEAGEANQNFYLTNQTNTSCTFKPVYDLGTPTEKINTGEIMEKPGYLYVEFTKEGQSITGGVRLNQRQLFGKDLTSIAGQYSGTIVFTTIAG